MLTTQTNTIVYVNRPASAIQRAESTYSYTLYKPTRASLIHTHILKDFRSNT